MAYDDETEADTRAQRIDPVLKASGWGKEPSRIRREVICPGRIQSGGRRHNALSCDYVLIHKGQKLAVIEAKRAGVSHREGVAQAKNYASRLGARFAYASNGLNWYSIDMETGEEGELSLPFPTPDALWALTFKTQNEWRERFGAVEFETDGGKWELRYYQHRAITAVLEAVANKQTRILLTLATGTGKTPIAFQIAWKLYQARWSLSGEPNRRPRILFLADRNILAGQAYNAFTAFPQDAVKRIDPDAIRKSHGQAPKNAGLFFTIFQTFMTGEDQPVYMQYPPDFFDFIIIDECHRGGANDESEWRALMDYFAPATQLGLTATPKRKLNADTYAYFGEPVYAYSLREGVEDGYLTPFKVRQMASTLDNYLFDGSDVIVAGELEEGALVMESDFNTKVEMRERELSRVKEFMGRIDQREKTLVFCATQRHAALVRDLINQVKTSKHPDYCHRVTADDGAPGEQILRDFQNNDNTIPTILTTSQKLSTGVDAHNVRNIVLMRPIRSMIEFKQIIGRGTRTYEGKDYFTIWDFVKAHENFNDPEWDGEPLAPEGPRRPLAGAEEPEPQPDATPTEPEGGVENEPTKIVIKLADGKERNIQYISTVTYWGPGGKPMSAQKFLEHLYGDLSSLVLDEDSLRKQWSDPVLRQRFIGLLEDRGYDYAALSDMRRVIDAPNSDLFDVLAYIRFTTPPKTRDERALAASEALSAEHSEYLKTFLIQILDAYREKGERELGPEKLPAFLLAKYGTLEDARRQLGEMPSIRRIYLGLQAALYKQ
jgi:type I restriction enzyme R subunit